MLTNIKNLPKCIFIISSVIFFIIFFLNFSNYVGNKFLFFIFQLCSLVLFLVAVKKKNTAFEFFFYLFLLLSFWFKFNCILYFESIKPREGHFDLLISNYDDATFIIIITFFSCICASFIKDFFFYNLNKEIKLKLNNSFMMFYKRYRFLVFLLFLGFLSLIWGTNFYFNIYSKGLVNEGVPPLVKNFYSWMLTYGLAVITSFLIYIDFLILKKKKIFILGLAEALFTQMNIYSRSFILVFAAYLRGFLLLVNIKKIVFSKLFVIKVFFSILIIFFLSFFLINNLRSYVFYKSEAKQIPTTLTSTFSDIRWLSVNRWVGIDALLAVSQNKNLNFNFFFSAWKEVKKIKEQSFYVGNFLKKFSHDENTSQNLNTVILPGIVAFLYYSGSVIFVFFSILILVLFCLFIEKLFYYASFGNIILTNIIGYTLASRLAHFGYVPYNTLNFFLSIIFSLICIIIITNILKKN
jgi:hypothetical protein